MSEKEEEKEVSAWEDFTQDVTMHGVRYVTMRSVSTVRKVLWLIFVLIALAYFTYGTWLLFDTYLKRLVTTKIKLRNSQNLEFPTVTVCNRNMWKKTAVENAANPAGYNETMRELIADIYAVNRPPPPDSKYDWTSALLSEQIKAHIPYTEKEANDFLGSLAHTPNETLMFCWVSAKMVPCASVFTVVKTDAGFCFRYNADGNVVTSVSGTNGGFQFVMDARTDEYYVGPFSYSEGFAIAVHDKDEEPIVNGLSYAAGVNADTFIVVNRKETNRVPPPADEGKSDCYDTVKLPNPLHYYKTYTLSGCKIECETAYILKKCGCRRFLSPPLNDTTCCSIKDQLLCAKGALEDFRSDPVHLVDCDCRTPCSDIKYSAVTSSLKFPSLNFALTNNFSTEVIHAMRTSWAMVSIYYGDMSYESVDEDLAIRLEDLIASLGGTMGVCFGGSLLTITEFGEFAIMALTRFISKRDEKKDEEKEKTQVKAFRNSIAHAGSETIYSTEHYK